MTKQQKGKGQSVELFLKRSISINGNQINKALIEIDHINYGINKKTLALNPNRRTNFSVADIERFLQRLDGEFILPRAHKKRISRYEVKIDCPVGGKFYNKTFIMIFELNYDKESEIQTITLFPGW